jgi:hypothetical protein
MNKRRKRTKAEEQMRRAKCEAVQIANAKEIGVLGQLAEMDTSERHALTDYIKEIGEQEENRRLVHRDRQVFATADAPEDVVEAVRNAKMDPRHNHLDDLLKEREFNCTSADHDKQP